MSGLSFPRLPYLSWTDNPSSTITIRYGSTLQDIDTIHYGERGQLDQQASANYGTEKEVTIRNLKPGTIYNYRISGHKSIYSFRTAPTVGKSFTFAVYGDFSSGGNLKVKQRLYQTVRRDRPAFLILTGDVVSNGNSAYSWHRNYFGPGSVITPYSPMMIAHGNHDGKNLFEHYLSYPGNGRWYSFLYSNARFLAIDTELNFSPNSPQYRFVEYILGITRARWKIVYLHKPPYSTNSGHHSDLKVRAYLSPLFEKYRVDIVFCGHNHGYERTRPIWQNQVNQQKGVTYITTGGGGAILTPFIPWSRLKAAEKSWSSVRIVRHHYLLVNVNQQRLHIQAKLASGSIIDELKIPKR